MKCQSKAKIYHLNQRGELSLTGSKTYDNQNKISCTFFITFLFNYFTVEIVNLNFESILF